MVTLINVIKIRVAEATLELLLLIPVYLYDKILSQPHSFCMFVCPIIKRLFQSSTMPLKSEWTITPDNKQNVFWYLIVPSNIWWIHEIDL